MKHKLTSLGLLFLTAALLLGLLPTPPATYAAPGAPDTVIPATDLPDARAATAAAVPEGLTPSEWTSIQAQIRQARYQVTWQTLVGGDAAYRAPNPAQGFDVAFAPEGFTASGADWRFGLRLTGYGDLALPPAAELTAAAAQVDYRWDDAVTEWYINQPEGVKHGFTLHAPPARGEVQLSLVLDTNLQPTLAAAGQVLTLRTAAGETLLRYDSLLVTDVTGRVLPARLELTPIGGSRITDYALRITLDAAGAAYPLTVDPLLHSEVAILHASDLQMSDNFGYAVSVSGDTLVVGAYLEDGGAGNPAGDAGAAYVFTRNQGGAEAWGEVAILHASDRQASDYFGWSVSVSGDTLVVGAYAEDGGAGDPAAAAGAAYVLYVKTWYTCL